MNPRTSSGASARRLGAAASLAVAVAACGGGGGARPAPVTAERKEAAGVLSEDDIRRVIGVVAAARQLPAERKVAFERLPKKAFVELLLADEDDDGHDGGLTPDAAMLVGFDFVPPPDARGGVSSVREVLEEQVAGFYDHRAGRIFVPMVPVATEGEVLEQRAVIAHEAHHAIQDQHFPSVLRDKSGGEDARLARLALIEGDAMVAMGAYIGAEIGAPAGRTVRRITDVTRKVPLDRFQRSDRSSRLGRALALTRDRLLFPYEEGMQLVADVYRAGGFPLVDRMYERPPRTTEHVLHPETYLAGEMPRPIELPATPKGYRSIVDETLGELQIRTLLSQCLRRDQAERAAAGWAGDRFLVAANDARQLAVGWVTAWDSDRDAEEFESALREGDGCWRDNRLGLDDEDYTVAAGHGSLRVGSVVGFVRGLDPARRRSWLGDLVRLPGPAPKPVPFAETAIPPRVPLPSPNKGRIEGDEYRSAWLGVSARLPAGLEASTQHSGLELVVSRADVVVRGALAVSERVTNAEQNDKTFEEVGRSFAEAMGNAGVPTESSPSADVTTPLGKGIERVWRGVGASIEMRMILVPICAGTGSIVLVTTYTDPLGKGVLDGWIGSFRWINGRNVVACGYLDPK